MRRAKGGKHKKKRDGEKEIERKLASLKSVWITAWFWRWDFLINVLTVLHNDWLAGWVTIKQIDWLADWLMAWGEGWKYIPSSLLEKKKERHHKEGDKNDRETMQTYNAGGYEQSGWKKKQGDGGRGSEEWEIDEERESSQSKDKKRHWRRGGSEVVRQRWRDSKRCLIKKRSFSCHHQESLCQPTASVSEKKRTETSSLDSLASNSIGTEDFRNKGRKKDFKRLLSHITRQLSSLWSQNW